MFVEAIVLFLFILLIEVNISLDCSSCPILSCDRLVRTRLSKGCLLDFARWKASFQKIRHFCFDDSTRCTCHGPSPLEFPWFSHLVGYPLERIFLSKKLMHYTSMPSPSSRILPPFGPLSPQNFLFTSLACMYIFWNYTILAIVSKPHASPILWRFRFSYHS